MAYRIKMKEVAEAEAEAAYFWLSQRNPEFAGRWYEGLLDAIATLAEMPRRHSVAPENDAFDVEVRQLLYGRGGSTFRILFFIAEEDKTVWVLHIRHSAQRPLMAKEDEEES